MPLTTTLGGDETSRAQNSIAWCWGGVHRTSGAKSNTRFKDFFFFFLNYVCFCKSGVGGPVLVREARRGRLIPQELELQEVVSQPTEEEANPTSLQEHHRASLSHK